MNETKKAGRKKADMTPRQLEIKRLIDKGADKRSEQESARLDQLKKEEKRERFLRLAPKRVNNVIVAIERLCGCGKKASYDYTAEEAAKIIAAVSAAVGEVESAFSERKKEKERFKL